MKAKYKAHDNQSITEKPNLITKEPELGEYMEKSFGIN